VDFAESDEHRALRASVAAIAAKFGPRYYAEHAAERRPCTELWQALGDAGFIGVNIGEEYGGGGGGLTELALVCEEIAAAGTPLLLLLVSAAISAEMISEFGTGEQRRTWLPGLASGAVKVVFAITEPDAGSNTLRISTTASKDGDDWLPQAWKGTCSRSTCCFLSASSPCTSTGSASARTRWSARKEPGSGRYSTVLIPNGSPVLPSASASRAMPWAPRPGTPPSVRSGPSRSAPTRASPIRWLKPRSRPSSRR
jgi:alkylation response protein AidB-like acyl-CoA dehydrogenase